MNNDEILRAAQENPVAEAENDTSRKAINWALGMGILLLTAMIVAEILLAKSIDFGKPALLLFIAALANILEGKHNHVRKMLFSGIAECVGAICLVLLYVGGLFR